MHLRSYVVVLVGLALGLSACSVNTLGTSMGSEAADESGASEADDELGSGEVTTTTSTSSNESDTNDCPQGAEGCPCTAGGGCDPGSMCDAGLCVPEAGDTTTGDTTTGDTTTTTTDDGDTTTTTGGDPFMCTLGRGCSEPDPSACACQGCNDNGYCTQSDDCVCPDCTNEGVCMGNACNTNGTCSPYYEGCECPDCAAHPLCG